MISATLRGPAGGVDAFPADGLFDPACSASSRSLAKRRASVVSMSSTLASAALAAR
jgi:hypothetical protein